MSMDPHPDWRDPSKQPPVREQLEGTMFDVPVDGGASSDPAWLAAPRSVIEWDFKRYHAAHPEVYAALEAAALRWATSGAPRVGVKRLVEEIRYSRLTVEQRANEYLPFKLNDHNTALYARLLIARHPNLADVIELRRRREADASSDEHPLAIFDPPRRCAKCKASEPEQGQILCADCAYDAFADDGTPPQRREGAA